MVEQSADAEIEAIGTVLRALEKLDTEAQDRVLDYALRRLGRVVARRPFRPTFQDSPSSPTQDVGEPPSHSRRPSGASVPADIRSLKEEKKPKSANEMAALVAYYLSELAPPEERTETIGPSDIERYFKQAQYPLPKATRNTLSNAATAGYFDFAGRGQYRLNPVGYNLVVHRMPSQAGPTDSRSSTKKSSRAKPTGTRKGTKKGAAKATRRKR